MYEVLLHKSHDWYLSVHHTILYYLLHFENILHLKEKIYMQKKIPKPHVKAVYQISLILRCFFLHSLSLKLGCVLQLRVPKTQ